MRARFVSLQLDAFGFFASLLCAVHCALLPLFLVLLPVARLDFLFDPAVELILVSGSLILAALSISGSYQKHGRISVPLAMLVGFASIFFGIFVASSIEIEILCTSLGGVLVALGHYLNWRYTHQH